MGDPTRLRIILVCLNEPISVGDIAARLDLSPSLVSHHLRLLKAARVLRAERRGKQIFYSVLDAHISCVVDDMVALIANFAMFIVELVASQLGDSMSLQADALDFFGDSANYAISLFVVGMALTVRARASLLKGATMALFGTWVIGSAAYRAIVGSAPEPMTMGTIALLALLVNVAVAILLYRFRNGDSNRKSIWLCSRNDAIGNTAVMVAAAGVLASGSRWPDLFVAAIIAALNISAAFHVVRLARTELHVSVAECETDSSLLAKIRLR